MAVPRKERAYEKYAWVIFLVIGIFSLIMALGSAFTGGEVEWASRLQSVTGTKWSELAASNPTLFKFIKLVNSEGGVLRVSLAALTIAVSVKSYRRGERWAWYLFWFLLIGFVATTAVNELYGVSIVGFSITFLVLFLLGLLLPYRKFFPKKQLT